MSQRFDDAGSPTETSPLLKDPKKTVAQGAPNGTTGPPAPIEGDGSAAERQESDVGRQKQFEGIPEVRKRMKYILPAMSIGVKPRAPLNLREDCLNIMC